MTTKTKHPDLTLIDREPWLCEGNAYRAALHVLETMIQNPDQHPDAPMPEPELVEVMDGVAYIPVRGVLLPYENLFSMLYGATTIDVLQAQILHASMNRSIMAVVLDVDSPGGSATGIAELAHHIRGLTLHKPMYAHCRKALSGAYWLASACQAIVAADETSEFGSVGAIIETRNLEGRAEQDGESVYVFSTGKLKVAGHPYVKMTGDHSQFLQQKALDLGLAFFQALENYRPQVRPHVEGIADGGTYYAGEAQTIGLIDETVPGLEFHAMITNP